MIERLKRIYRKEMFNPGVLGIFINPFFFIRRGLHKGISSNVNFMQGEVLDFGCGKKPYRNLFKVKKYIGIDIEESGNESSKDAIDVFYDGEKIPFNSEHFDSIFSSEVFEHVFELEKVLNELYRVCKPGGHLLATVPFVWDEHEQPYDFGRYSSFGIKYLLNKAGFEIIIISKSTNYVETIFQMWNAYVWQHILRVRFFQVIFTPLIISPVTIIGLAISWLLPKNYNFYHNNIIVAKKTI